MTARAAAAVLLAAALSASAARAQGAPPVPPASGMGEQAPSVTLLYQNFPNPFSPSAEARTCIWFDLAEDSEVRLEVLDIRGRPVRVILPAPGFFGTVPSGRYGRGAGSACDPVLSWDGRSQDDDIVPTGVYLLRLTAGGERVTRKIIIRER